MEQHILALSGSKQSGKTTCTNFLFGYQLRFHDIIEKFYMDDKGQLLVGWSMLNENGEEEEGVGVWIPIIEILILLLIANG